jgi:hypothetical protein
LIWYDRFDIDVWELTNSLHYRMWRIFSMLLIIYSVI